MLILRVHRQKFGFHLQESINHFPGTVGRNIFAHLAVLPGFVWRLLELSIIIQRSSKNIVSILKL